ncbi:TetR/AcrR family transcriptional regulator [Aeromonas allosaccharophila]|uniref:TetR/AcrR family transcriptional regulator n=1 Tax=Aeromonas allosaccharophila TaxID=656 RepID=UPI0013C8B697|nr:TetR/AcrR family transcriptional regulator [Aeromonas allosaccharophila]MCE9952988.1 TetR/AcrR family transcriptional regulator [Aeromonas allosaccharophila]WDO02182.1 TetR/AcrR family transcriptional regulator [Aeromonas allosaccharophila]
MRVKSEERRQAILDVAREAFTQLGFENTTMSEIANRTGGSKATLYNYFSSKEELFAAVIDEFGRQRIAEAFMSMNPDKPVREEITRLGLHYLRFILNPDVIGLRAVIVHESARTNIGREYYRLGPQRGWQYISQYIEQQSRSGQLCAIENSWAAAMHLKGLLEVEMLEPLLLGARACPDDKEMAEVVERAINVFMLAYGPR